MPKLPAITPRKLEQKLKKFGFVLDHSSGSHRVYFHHETGRRAVVPFHAKDVKSGTLSAILREARISRNEFVSSLTSYYIRSRK